MYNQVERWKLVTIGAPESQKSQLLRKIAKQNQVEFSFSLFSLPMTCYFKEILLDVWDMAWQSLQKKLYQPYINNAKGLIFVFDFDNQHSFSQLEKAMSIMDISEINLPKLLIGFRSNNQQQSVSQGKALKFSVIHKMTFIQISSKEDKKSINGKILNFAQQIYQHERITQIEKQLKNAFNAKLFVPPNEELLRQIQEYVSIIKDQNREIKRQMKQYLYRSIELQEENMRIKSQIKSYQKIESSLTKWKQEQQERKARIENITYQSMNKFNLIETNYSVNLFETEMLRLRQQFVQKMKAVERKLHQSRQKVSILEILCYEFEEMSNHHLSEAITKFKRSFVFYKLNYLSQNLSQIDEKSDFSSSLSFIREVNSFKLN